MSSLIGNSNASGSGGNDLAGQDKQAAALNFGGGGGGGGDDATSEEMEVIDRKWAERVELTRLDGSSRW